MTSYSYRYVLSEEKARLLRDLVIYQISLYDSEIAAGGTSPFIARRAEAQKVKVICTYLSAWEKVAEFQYSPPSKGAGAATKIAGLRYVLMLIPTIWDKAVADHRFFDEDFIVETLNAFIASLGVLRAEFYTCDEHKLYFRDRTATAQFVDDSIRKIKGLNAGAFNPLG